MTGGAYAGDMVGLPHGQGLVNMRELGRLRLAQVDWEAREALYAREIEHLRQERDEWRDMATQERIENGRLQRQLEALDSGRADHRSAAPPAPCPAADPRSG